MLTVKSEFALLLVHERVRKQGIRRATGAKKEQIAPHPVGARTHTRENSPSQLAELQLWPRGFISLQICACASGYSARTLAGGNAHELIATLRIYGARRSAQGRGNCMGNKGVAQKNVRSQHARAQPAQRRRPPGCITRRALFFNILREPHNNALVCFHGRIFIKIDFAFIIFALADRKI
jgi:hypothetical protein